MTELLPSLLLRILAALLPVLVALTSLAEMHWTRSAENRSMMVKTFTLLLFMVLVLPTLGLTSINTLLELKWLNNKNDDSIKWRCVSDNGAFFLKVIICNKKIQLRFLSFEYKIDNLTSLILKYITTCAIIGTALDLLRLPDLFLYLIRMMWSRSSAERHAVKMVGHVFFSPINYGIFCILLNLSRSDLTRSTASCVRVRFWRAIRLGAHSLHGDHLLQCGVSAYCTVRSPLLG